MLQRQVLLGEHSNQSYRMGDLIEVKVLAVNLEARKIDLGIVGTVKHQLVNGWLQVRRKGGD